MLCCYQRRTLKIQVWTLIFLFVGFGGNFCEIKISYCENNLCEHNSTCEEDDGTFRCHCKDGYIGKRCHLLPCDYKPCKTKEVCENIVTPNATKDSYK